MHRTGGVGAEAAEGWCRVACTSGWAAAGGATLDLQVVPRAGVGDRRAAAVAVAGVVTMAPYQGLTARCALVGLPRGLGHLVYTT